MCIRDRGNTYKELKEYQKALADFNKAIEIKPDLAEAYLVRGGTHYELKEYQKAFDDVQKASDLFDQQRDPEGYQAAQQFLEIIKQELQNNPQTKPKN